MPNNPARILHVEASTSYGGSIRALQSYLANCGKGDFVHDVLLYHPTDGTQLLAPLVNKVITLRGKRPGRTIQGPKRNRLKAAVRRLIPTSIVETLSEVVAVAKSIPTCIRIFQFLRTSGYDLVHVNNTFNFQPATLIAAKLARIPVVAHVRNPQPPSLINRLLIRAAGRVVTVCRYHERQIESWQSGVPVVTCYDSVEPPNADEHLAAQLRDQLCDKDRFLIGSVGRLDEQKGYSDLILAARHIVEVRTDFNLVIAGDGPLRDELQQLICRLGLENRVKLCGFRSDVPLFLKSLDLFVSSSHWEGLPLVVVEAMLLKVPVVATDVCGNSEVVLPGRTGVLVTNRDPVALAEGIITSLDTRKRERFTVNDAEKLASRMFSPTANASSLDAVFLGALPRLHAYALQSDAAEYSQ